MGRRKDPNSRRSKAEKRRADKAAEAAAKLAQRGQPNERVLEKRLRFAFLKPERGGSIDQDIHDAIGQLHALGLLNGHGHDAKDLRDIGREYAELYWERYDATAPRTGGFEPRSPSTGAPPPRNARYDRFDRLDNALAGFERMVLHMLLTDHYYTDDITGWAQRLVDRAFAERANEAEPHQGCAGHDKHMLEAAVRGLCQLFDASLPMRRAA